MSFTSSASSVLAPSAAVRIEGGPIRWYSRFDIDTRIVPGIGRKIKDNRTGDEVYRIIFWQQGLYQVRTADDRSVQVEIRKDAYLFGKPMMPVTAMTERITEADWIPANHMEVEPYFRTTVCIEDVLTRRIRDDQPGFFLPQTQKMDKSVAI